MNNIQNDAFTSSLLPPNRADAPSASSSVFDIPIQNHPPSQKYKDSAAVASPLGNVSLIEACYVLPVSDDGGSSSEIIRVIGSSPLDAIRRLLAYRFPASVSEHEARDEWRSVVEGRSPLWKGIPSDRKEAIRGFLVHFEGEVLKRAHKNFSFRNGSVGNYLLAAAQGFFRSLPSAIFFFSSITNSQANILPVVVTNHTVTIAAELADSSTLVGQCEISHPVKPVVSVSPASPTDIDAFDGTRLLGTHNANFEKSSEGSKEGYSSLPARIARLFYINPYGHEIYPSPNPDFLNQLAERDVLVYSCGSLWTSIIPCLALRGVASAIARSSSLKAKVLLLNSKNDRETEGLTSLDYIRAIVNTLRSTDVSPSGIQTRTLADQYPSSAFITHLVYLKGTMVAVDVKEIHAIGVRCIEIDNGAGLGQNDDPKFDAASVQEALTRILSQEDGEA
ncbi:hypothetical protein JB92DRAFT_2900010 [Gautieria morchelliformis]|nr:hypothetical protein JB92DRAFT_2900010 [Gautieria morchelliformis]